MRVCPHESVNCTQKNSTGPLSRRGMVIAPRYDKKNQKIVLALCPDEGWSPPREKNKKNITESMFRREADSFLVSVFYPRIIFIPRLVQELMESFCE